MKLEVYHGIISIRMVVKIKKLKRLDMLKIKIKVKNIFYKDKEM